MKPSARKGDDGVTRKAGYVMPVDVAPDEPTDGDEVAGGETRASLRNFGNTQKIMHGQPRLQVLFLV